ncbi:uncharacterized protein C8orf74 homolog [Lingula anatina]|uniref:Uncharacterized protein C8orf74 homolog n=1 Tax=Lingula anatina TaxID=7574 RepID=A0A1S3IFL6_LINAN|nr:uncharacterized protein C8orf74 homolog [Lingula anatina]XP_023930826.1 uncharacterized protein C8orf74 homolog [Lingula anatina]|eukprot:XP_013396651.1 uncharacterized protein C8orf74 homolog [Lingula anatina]
MAGLTTDQVKAIASTKGRRSARGVLADCLSWELNEDDVKQIIQLDYLYDTIMFAIEKGFAWSQVCLVVQLSMELLKETVDQPITEAIKILKSKCCHYNGKISGRNIQLYTDYFFDTFMKHFKLYQYVFTREREKWNTQLNLTVELPRDPLPCSSGKQQHLWEYDQKWTEIEQKETEKKTELAQKKTVVSEENDKTIKEAYREVEQLEETADKETIAKTVAAFASAHMKSAIDNLRLSIEEAEYDLDFKLEKTSLARPQELGPPPRYNTKSPIRGNSPVGRKSANSKAKGRDKSSKGKK